MDDQNTLMAFIVTFVAGASTAIGAALTFLIKRNDFKFFALGMSFSAGVMIYLSFMDILPMSIEHMAMGNGGSAGLGEKLGHFAAVGMFFVGAIIAGIIDHLVPEHVDRDMIQEDVCRDEARGDERVYHACMKRSKATHAALFTALALFIHNFPEGLSVFVTTMEDVTIGLAVGLAIMLHNIPEGVAVALPVYNATGSKKRAFWTAALSGMAEPLGAVVAYFILAPFLSPVIIGGALALTAGLMVYISLDELLPMAREHAEAHYAIIGVFAGMALMATISIVI